MKRDDLIKQCRYFKGEKENPYTDNDPNKTMFWGYERKWVDWYYQHNDLDDNPLDAMTYDYIHSGMSDFNTNDGVPISLKSLLFNRYFHWNDYATPDDFKKWYVCYYLNIS
ncbi:MAG: hypothetical protein J6Y82_11390 [Bacteroidales bacterium]|nr:hypothetical protein [Bacteroidales bacterium]